MPKGKRGHHGKHNELLEWHLIFTPTDDRFGKRSEFEEAVRGAREVFMKTGAQSPGVHVTVRWRNPESESDYSRMWKTSDDSDQTLEAAFDTIITKVIR